MIDVLPTDSSPKKYQLVLGLGNDGGPTCGRGRGSHGLTTAEQKPLHETQ